MATKSCISRIATRRPQRALTGSTSATVPASCADPLDRVIVIGGSLAGLLASAATAPYARRVVRGLLSGRPGAATGVRLHRSGDARGDEEDLDADLIAPDLPRAAFAFRQENGTWILSLAKYSEAPPPMDTEGFRAFARTLPAPEIAELLDGREMLHEPGSRIGRARRRGFVSSACSIRHTR